MSRNNKSAKNVARRKACTAARQSGNPGKPTKPVHGKKKAWWQIFPSYGAYIAGGKKPQRGQEA
jgi:hypothetical protein